jgi:hypothetical protein
MDELLAEAAKAMGFNAYNVPGGDIMDLAKKLPTGRLYATGKRFVPNIKSSLYSLLIVTLAGEPQATLLGKDEPPRAGDRSPTSPFMWWQECTIAFFRSSSKSAWRVKGWGGQSR